MKEALDKAVSLIHNRGYVHGDPWPQKILIILDFDWAGKYPDARYSSQLNMTCDWYDDVECGRVISADHDLYEITHLEAL